MPPVSRRKLDYKIEKELLESLEYILTHSSSQEIKLILKALLTRSERLMIAKRLGVALMLNEGYPASTIDNILKVTRATVDKFEMIISDNIDGFMLALKKEEQRKVKEGLKEVFKAVAKAAISSAFGKVPTPKL